MGVDVDRLEKMRDHLIGYRDLIERERHNALDAKFEDFMEHIGLDPESDDLRVQFFRMIELIGDESLDRTQRISAAIESDFLYSLLSARTGATHREMRMLTRELSQFVGAASKNARTENDFVRNLISGSLRQLSEAIERPNRGEPGSEDAPTDFWVDAIRTGLEEYLATI